MRFDPFERFYTEEVRLFDVHKPTGYDRSGETLTELGVIRADVQPYNGSLAFNEYGVERECNTRMFCKADKLLTEGIYAEINGKKYRVEYAADWKKTGAEALLKEV